jgi:HEAT repeat protein
VNERLVKPITTFELTKKVKLVLALAYEKSRKELVQEEINRRKHELKSSHSHTRIRALWALGELGQHDSTVLDLLENIAQKDSDYYVRRAANEALSKIHSSQQ